MAKRVLVVGGGFAGLNAALGLGRLDVDVTVVDPSNHHLFQPLLYQVAMAGLSPAQIAAPIRSLLSRFPRVRVIQDAITSLDPAGCTAEGEAGPYPFDYAIVAAGARHSYFGRERWEEHAPGLKTLPQATEVRRRVLTAYERAEREQDPEERRRLLSFVIVGGGPTGVELAGALAEMSRTTLARDFRVIDPALSRITLLEAGPRILATFDPELSAAAARHLEALGVQVWANARASAIDERGVVVGDDRLAAATVLWAAGVRASPLAAQLGSEVDRLGRVPVGPDLAVEGHAHVFALGDLARFEQDGEPLPGIAPVALQQGRHVARVIAADLAGRARPPFLYVDKGTVATIGRSRAILQMGRLRTSGAVAWWLWLLVHIYYLTGFQNRLLVLIQWAWSYLTFGRGARLIVPREWRFFTDPPGTT